jgi:hypothetical protein
VGGGGGRESEGEEGEHVGEDWVILMAFSQPTGLFTLTLTTHRPE